MSLSNYTPPQFHKKKFTCPHCNTYSNMNWEHIGENDWLVLKNLFNIEPTQNYSYGSAGIYICTPDCCANRSYWLGHREGHQSISTKLYDQGLMIWPNLSIAEQSHTDMPLHIKRDYEEARQIVAISPRAAAALLRLAIQKLMKELGEEGENINKDIASLVSKGVPQHIQQALDYCRVTGNNAVHPGVLNLDDTPEMVNTMFSLINIIVHSQISIPKQAEEAFQGLPEGARAAIARRDGTNSED